MCLETLRFLELGSAWPKREPRHTWMGHPDPFLLSVGPHKFHKGVGESSWTQAVWKECVTGSLVRELHPGPSHMLLRWAKGWARACEGQGRARKPEGRAGHQWEEVADGVRRS